MSIYLVWSVVCVVVVVVEADHPAVEDHPRLSSTDRNGSGNSEEGTWNISGNERVRRSEEYDSKAPQLVCYVCELADSEVQCQAQQRCQADQRCYSRTYSIPQGRGWLTDKGCLGEAEKECVEYMSSCKAYTCEDDFCNYSNSAVGLTGLIPLVFSSIFIGVLNVL